MLLLLWFIVPYLTQIVLIKNSMMLIHFYRFAMPSLPVIVLILAAAILKIQWKTIKIILVSAIVLITGFQFVVISYNVASLKPMISNSWSDPSSYDYAGSPYYYHSGPPWRFEVRSEDWHIDEIISIISKNTTGGNGKIGVGVLSTSTSIEFYLVILLKYRLKASDISGVNVSSFPCYTKDGADFLKGLTYIITLPESEYNETLMQDNAKHDHRFEDIMTKFNETFKLVQEFPLPGGGSVKIYKKIAHEK